MDIDGAARIFLTDTGFDLIGDLEVVYGVSGGRVVLKELRADHCTGEVIGDELADLTGFHDVFAHARESFGRRLEIGGNDTAADESVFDYLGVTYIGGEE